MVINDNIRAQEKNKDMIRWTIGGWMPRSFDGSRHLGLAGAISGIQGNILIVAGGANFPEGMPWQGGAKRYYKLGYVFKVSQKEIEFTGRTFELPFNVAYGASCSTGFGVLNVGGENEDGVSDKALLIQWDEKNETINTRYLPDLPFPVTNTSVAVHGTVVFLAGGETADGVSNIFLCFDLRNKSGQWKILPSIPKPVSHAVMVVQSDGGNDCIYLLGGRKKNKESISEFYSSNFQFDITGNKWFERRHLPFAVSAGTGIAQGRSRIYLFGGDKGETFNKTESLILAVQGESDSVQRQLLSSERTRVQAFHPGFFQEVLMYDTAMDDWTTIGTIPFESPVSTNAVRINERIIVIPGGEIRAGTRTPQILLGEFAVE